MPYPHWDNIYSARDIDEMIRLIEQIDKDSEYVRLSYIVKHDKNRGYDQEVLESLK